MSQSVNYTSLLYQRDGYVVAYCPELNVGSFGDDVEAARASLREAVECFAGSQVLWRRCLRRRKILSLRLHSQDGSILRAEEMEVVVA